MDLNNIEHYFYTRPFYICLFNFFHSKDNGTEYDLIHVGSTNEIKRFILDKYFNIEDIQDKINILFQKNIVELNSENNLNIIYFEYGGDYEPHDYNTLPENLSSYHIMCYVDKYYQPRIYEAECIQDIYHKRKDLINDNAKYISVYSMEEGELKDYSYKL